MICVHRIHDLNSKRQIWKITDSLAQINQHTANHLFAEKNIIRARRSALIVLLEFIPAGALSLKTDVTMLPARQRFASR